MGNIDANLVLTLFSAVVLPLIVVINLWDRKAPSSPLSAYMWREEPLLWSLGLAFLSLLALYSAVDLALRIGWLPAASADLAVPVIGLPATVLALAVLVLGSRAAIRAYAKRTKS